MSIFSCFIHGLGLFVAALHHLLLSNLKAHQGDGSPASYLSDQSEE